MNETLYAKNYIKNELFKDITVWKVLKDSLKIISFTFVFSLIFFPIMTYFLGMHDIITNLFIVMVFTDFTLIFLLFIVYFIFVKKTILF